MTTAHHLSEGKTTARCVPALAIRLLAPALIACVVAACGPSPTQTQPPAPTDTHTPAVTRLPSATPTLTRTPRPTRTPTAPAGATGPGAATPTPLDATEGPSPTPTIRGVEDAPPPFEIDLPDDWNVQFNQVNLVMPDGTRQPFKLAFYNGPAPAHQAVITVLWDYTKIFEDVWRDGIALVQVVFDPSCQFNLVGSPPGAETFTLGAHYAEGITYTVTNCADMPDLAGWLVGFRRADINYLLYIQVAPLDFAEDDFPFVQRILDTIRFPGE